MRFHLFCRPVVFTRDGADHVGVDAYARCYVCRRETTHHVECWEVTPKVRSLLMREWRAGRTTDPPSNSKVTGGTP